MYPRSLMAGLTLAVGSLGIATDGDCRASD